MLLSHPAPPHPLGSLPLRPASALSVSGAQVHEPSQSLLTLEGDDVETFNHALQHVAYMNTLRLPRLASAPALTTGQVSVWWWASHRARQCQNSLALDANTARHACIPPLVLVMEN